GYLHALVVADELQRLLQRQRPRRDQPHQLVRGRRAHVRQLLLLRRVHVQILGARVFADDHSLVDLDSRADEQLAPLLQVQQRERGRRSAPIGDEASRRPAAQLSVPRLVAVAPDTRRPRSSMRSSGRTTTWSLTRSPRPSRTSRTTRAARPRVDRQDVAQSRTEAKEAGRYTGLQFELALLDVVDLDQLRRP